MGWVGEKRWDGDWAGPTTAGTGRLRLSTTKAAPSSQPNDVDASERRGLGGARGHSLAKLTRPLARQVVPLLHEQRKAGWNHMSVYHRLSCDVCGGVDLTKREIAKGKLQ